MNSTESAYADILQAKKLAGEIIEWWFEDMTFVLADRCRFTPDFCVLHINGSMELIDVKGSQPIEGDSLVKLKTAAAKFYCFDWTIAQRQTKKNGGGWDIRRL
jgi:hypothetical protein